MNYNSMIEHLPQFYDSFFFKIMGNTISIVLFVNEMHLVTYVEYWLKASADPYTLTSDITVSFSWRFIQND